MSSKMKTHVSESSRAIRRAPASSTQVSHEAARQLAPAPAPAQVLNASPSTLVPGDILTLQRAVGNRAVGQILGAMVNSSEPPIQAKENRTGLPDQLKAGIENLSGMSMDDVRVHYNSAQPARVGALAYTQGNNIHVGPKQEEHLPHEAWHAVQQKQGRVRPTLQLKGVAINDEAGLETEASVMGARALQAEHSSRTNPDLIVRGQSGEPAIQARAVITPSTTAAAATTTAPPTTTTTTTAPAASTSGHDLGGGVEITDDDIRHGTLRPLIRGHKRDVELAIYKRGVGWITIHVHPGVGASGAAAGGGVKVGRRPVGLDSAPHGIVEKITALPDYKRVAEGVERKSPALASRDWRDRR